MLKNKIKKLIHLIENTQIDEIEVSSFWGAQKIKLSKAKAKQNIPTFNKKEDIDTDIILKDDKAASLDSKNMTDTVGEKEVDTTDNILREETYEDETKFKIIKAPLVGTFYSSSKPTDPPFIKIGDKVEEGMTVCIIEAMKIFNDIESEFTGKLIEVYAEDGTPVEYGQELFVLRIDNV